MAEPLHLTGYMDETGHAAANDQRFCGMAGFIAPAQNWERFEIKWKRMLKDFKIPYFHMREFAHSVGVFTGWKGKEHKRRKLIDRALTITASIHPIPVGSIVSLEAYRSLSEEDRELYMEPYLASLMDCVGVPASYIQNAPLGTQFSIVFSDQAEFRHRAHRVYDGFKKFYDFGRLMTPPEFKDMRQLVHLQAADLIAYELNKEFERRLYKPTDYLRYPYKEIFKMAQRVGGSDVRPFMFHDKESVEGFIRDVRDGLTSRGLPASVMKEEWRKFFSEH